VSWDEAASAHFAARFGPADAGAAAAVLAALEDARARFAERLPAVPDGTVDVVLHGTRAQLHLAQPPLLAVPPSLRELVLGRASGHTLHLLTPRLHGDERVAPALLGRLAVLASSPALRKPLRRARYAWLVDGTGEWLAGRVDAALPHVRRVLRAGAPPPFPPSLRDVPVFAGAAVALVARDAGLDGLLALLAAPGPAPAGLAATWPRYLERLVPAAER